MVLRCAESDGFVHEIFMTNEFTDSGIAGAIACKNPRTGDLLTAFSDEVLSRKGEISSRVERIDADSPADLKEKLTKVTNRISAEMTAEKGEALLGMLSAAAKTPEEKKVVERLREIHGKIKSIGEHDEKTCDCPVCIGKKADMKITNSAEYAYARLKVDGDLCQPVRLRDVTVGTKFFDKNNSLLYSVGFEDGAIKGDYINAVFLVPNQRDAHEGMPIKLDLDETIVPVK